MKFSEKILRGKYFPVGSRDRLKATLVNLLLLLAMMIMVVDVYGSIIHGYYVMSLIEGTSAVIFLITYLLFFIRSHSNIPFILFLRFSPFYSNIKNLVLRARSEFKGSRDCARTQSLSIYNS